MQISDCRALLTGASGGIGLALAETLAAQGAQLLLVGRQVEALQQLASRYAGRVEVLAADITERAGRDAVLAAARRLGGVNTLINGAGINSFTLLEQQDDEEIAALVNLNVTATLQLTQRLLPLLRQQGRGLVVNMGSTFGSIGYPGFVAYCTSKFAVRGFSEALRRELADTQLKVLYIAPRATRTAMNGDNVVAMNDELKVAMDEPQVVAMQVLKAIQSEREESYLGWPEKFFVKFNSLLPRAVDQSLSKQLPVIQRFVKSKL